MRTARWATEMSGHRVARHRLVNLSSSPAPSRPPRVLTVDPPKASFWCPLLGCPKVWERLWPSTGRPVTPTWRVSSPLLRTMKAAIELSCTRSDRVGRGTAHRIYDHLSFKNMCLQQRRANFGFHLWTTYRRWHSESILFANPCSSAHRSQPFLCSPQAILDRGIHGLQISAENGAKYWSYSAIPVGLSKGRALAISLIGETNIIVAGTTSGTRLYPSGKRSTPPRQLRGTAKKCSFLVPPSTFPQNKRNRSFSLG